MSSTTGSVSETETTQNSNTDSDEEDSSSLSEYNSYDEFYEEELVNDSTLESEMDISYWKTLALKGLFYLIIAVFLLFILGTILYVSLEILQHLAEFAGEHF